MEDIAVGGYIVSVDVERTRAIYACMNSGGWQTCGCAGCANFGQVVLSAFPAEVLAFFMRAGVDPLKAAEVYEQGESSPGFHSYGGEYYLWGRVVEDAVGELRQHPLFRMAFTGRSPLAPDEFRDDGALCFLFDAELPWMKGGNAV